MSSHHQARQHVRANTSREKYSNDKLCTSLLWEEAFSKSRPHSRTKTIAEFSPKRKVNLPKHERLHSLPTDHYSSTRDRNQDKSTSINRNTPQSNSGKDFSKQVNFVKQADRLVRNLLRERSDSNKKRSVQSANSRRSNRNHDIDLKNVSILTKNLKQNLLSSKPSVDLKDKVISSRRAKETNKTRSPPKLDADLSHLAQKFRSSTGSSIPKPQDLTQPSKPSTALSPPSQPRSNYNGERRRAAVGVATGAKGDPVGFLFRLGQGKKRERK
mgnify:CR=1 FL=1